MSTPATSMGYPTQEERVSRDPTHRSVELRYESQTRRIEIRLSCVIFDQVASGAVSLGASRSVNREGKNFPSLSILSDWAATLSLVESLEYHWAEECFTA